MDSHPHPGMGSDTRPSQVTGNGTWWWWGGHTEGAHVLLAQEFISRVIAGRSNVTVWHRQVISL